MQNQTSARERERERERASESERGRKEGRRERARGRKEGEREEREREERERARTSNVSALIFSMSGAQTMIQNQNPSYASTGAKTSMGNIVLCSLVLLVEVIV